MNLFDYADSLKHRLNAWAGGSNTSRRALVNWLEFAVECLVIMFVFVPLILGGLVAMALAFFWLAGIACGF